MASPFPSLGPAHDLLQGNPFGQVYPPRPEDGLPSTDARTLCLRVLRKYIAELTFFRPGAVGGAPLPFKIPEKNIHIERPDAVVDMVFPSIVFVQESDGEYVACGLTSQLDESSRDVWGQGTALQVQSEYTENVVLEVHAAKKPERRSVIAGLEVALVPSEYMYGIRFRVPEYFNETVCFTLNKTSRPDDDSAVRDRRVGRMTIEMRFNVVRRVNYSPLEPSIVVDTFAPDEDRLGGPPGFGVQLPLNPRSRV